VNGLLYLCARNATNSQLAWSEDHGTNWTWATWRFSESFGAPSFLDFGKNNANARDQFVYLYSHDSDSAYRPSSRIVLARVPWKSIRDRAAYEFFAGFNSSNQPEWDREISHRSGVVNIPDRAWRTRVTYNAALKRYLLVQPIPTNNFLKSGEAPDTRFAGGLAILDAPEPWGPWTTVFFTSDWDVGPGDSASFPSKWISSNGRELNLVFSGNDSFSIRRATLELKAD
jgi:hypothetical protein